MFGEWFVMSSQEQLTLLKTNAVISVVDDDASIRNSQKRLLGSMGFEVRTYASALEFLNQGPLQDHGCVIVDVRMPEMNGLDLQKRLSDLGVPLPVIFITAYEDPQVRAQAMRAGALAFLLKPFNDATLMDAVYLALERSLQRISDNSYSRHADNRPGTKEVTRGMERAADRDFRKNEGKITTPTCIVENSRLTFLERNRGQEARKLSLIRRDTGNEREDLTATYWG